MRKKDLLKLGLAQAEEIAMKAKTNGTKIIVEKFELGGDRKAMSNCLQAIRDKNPESAIMIFSKDDKKVWIVVSVGPSLCSKLGAGDWAKEVASVCGGKGGGKPDAAQASGDDITKYEDAIKRDPQNPVYYNNLASSLTKIADFNGAKAQCEKALELDSKYVKAWARKGEIEFFQKEYHKALDSFRKGLQYEPDNQFCKDGIIKTNQKINSDHTGEVDMERAQHGLADPEIQQILMDPIVRNVLNDLQENPKEGQKALQNPEIFAKIQKLINAGILKTG